MTVSTSNNRVSYYGDGATTNFATNFRILDETHVEVRKLTIAGVESVLTVNVDYTVTGVGNTTSTIVMSSAPAGDGNAVTSDTILLRRNMPFTQEVDYVALDDFPAEAHETALDARCMENQQLREAVDRAMTQNPFASGVSTELPAPVAGDSLRWAEDGLSLENYTPGSAELQTPASGSVTTDSLASGLLVPASKGGTGKSTWTSGTLLLGNGASTPTELAPSTARKVAISDGSTWTARALAVADMPAGMIIGRAHDAYTTRAATGTTIPLDNTIPQNTEGDQILSASVTPTAAADRVRVRAVIVGEHSSATGKMIMALFIDSTADALRTAMNVVTGSNDHNQVVLEFEHSPATTSAVTYKIRAGTDSGTLTLNSYNGGSVFGGTLACTLTVDLIKG